MRPIFLRMPESGNMKSRAEEVQAGAIRNFYNRRRVLVVLPGGQMKTYHPIRDVSVE